MSRFIRQDPINLADNFLSPPAQLFTRQSWFRGDEWRREDHSCGFRCGSISWTDLFPQILTHSLGPVVTFGGHICGMYRIVMDFWTACLQSKRTKQHFYWHKKNSNFGLKQHGHHDEAKNNCIQYLWIKYSDKLYIFSAIVIALFPIVS